ncbi:hypothetical protein Bca52824_018065 [Brassica carinata]|uniref:Uncharacterized protein n=1 Tax=Brassica carinata TaxID=52824 RepID=A0A8X7VN75_BRACI|nr:hypothetical protein Bca52824_018065 [Brassica carinata]
MPLILNESTQSEQVGALAAFRTEQQCLCTPLPSTGTEPHGTRPLKNKITPELEPHNPKDSGETRNSARHHHSSYASDAARRGLGEDRRKDRHLKRRPAPSRYGNHRSDDATYSQFPREDNTRSVRDDRRVVGNRRRSPTANASPPCTTSRARRQSNSSVQRRSSHLPPPPPPPHPQRPSEASHAAFANCEAISQPSQIQGSTQHPCLPLERNLNLSDFPPPTAIPTMDQVMDDLLEATYQYANHPDPKESEARRQRVLENETRGLMEETTLRIIATASASAALSSPAQQLVCFQPEPGIEQTAGHEITLNSATEAGPSIPAAASQTTPKVPRPPKPKRRRQAARWLLGANLKKHNLAISQRSPAHEEAPGMVTTPRMLPRNNLHHALNATPGDHKRTHTQ